MAEEEVTAEQMEYLIIPSAPEIPGMPSPAAAGAPAAAVVTAAATLAAVADQWTDSCSGNDSAVYANNCAHHLSDAFIRAGFTELNPPNDHIHARCDAAKRPIRARDMWSWFESKATETSDDPTRGTGWWAVFQLNEEVYWGGHVALLDSDTWTFCAFQNHWFGDWDQYLYQW